MATVHKLGNCNNGLSCSRLQQKRRPDGLIPIIRVARPDHPSQSIWSPPTDKPSSRCSPPVGLRAAQVVISYRQTVVHVEPIEADRSRSKPIEADRSRQNREEQIIETQDKPQCLVAAKATLTLTVPGCNRVVYRGFIASVI